MTAVPLARVFWSGPFLGETAIARANRELARAALADGRLDVVPCGEPSAHVDELLGLLPQRRENVPADGLPAVTLQHRRFPALPRVRPGRNIVWHGAASRTLPMTWAPLLRDQVDETWSYTRRAQNAALALGLAPERAHIIPLGIDPAIYHPGVAPVAIEPPDICFFLFVGDAGERKNLDALLTAYRSAFGAGENVALLVKDNSYTYRDDRDGDEAQRTLERLREQGGPPVHFIDAQYAEGDLARLYRSAAALVLPYRAATFGLVALEAMACGTPAIVTADGTCDAFVDDSVGYRVPSTRVRAGETERLEVDIEQLGIALRRVFGAREEARAKGRAAAERVHGAWTWAHAARHLIERVLAVAAQPQHSALPPDDPNAYARKRMSQHGEDGVLEEIFARLHVGPSASFAEFGVQDGIECNAGFFARNLGWGGLMIEGNVESARALAEHYRDFPATRTTTAFITRENIVELFRAGGVPEDLDLLSIDIDGNDFYVWEALANYRARVVIAEYNGTFAPPMRWVMVYNPEHQWTGIDDYFGASLSSMTALGRRLGYALIGTNPENNNAFFVRRDLLALSGFPEVTAEAAYHKPLGFWQHREGPALAL